MRPAGRREYSLEEVALAIRRRGGPTISASYLWLLRTGRKANPTKRHLEALASFFGVPPAYFFDDALGARSAADLDLLATLRAAPLRRIAVAAASSLQRVSAPRRSWWSTSGTWSGGPGHRRARRAPRAPRAPRHGRRPRAGPALAPALAPAPPSPSSTHRVRAT